MLRSSILAILFVITAGLAVAQTVDNSGVERFQLAETFIQAGQYDRAIPLLEELVRTAPETHVFYERLRDAYEQVKRYDAAIALVENRASNTASPEVFLVEKARLQFLKGDEAGARATWSGIIDRQPGSSSVYLMVYRSLLQVRMFDFAIEILERGRRETGNNTLFQTDLGQLYSLTSDHASALREYVGLLASNGGQLNFVKSRLGPYLTSPESIDASIPVAEEAVARDPLNRSFRELLAWLYVEAERYRDALVVFQAIDRLENEEGRALFGFALTAADGSAFDVAMEAFEEILTRYPDAPSAPDAMRGLGIMQERWAESLSEQPFDENGDRTASHYEDAIGTYERFLIDYPQHTHVADVLRRMGRLHQDVFMDFEAAELVLSEVIARYPATVAADEAAFDMGRLAVTTDRLTDARIRFSRLLTRLRTGELADAARFELARLHFYQGEFDAALGLAEAMQENTATDVANDAIELKVLLNENRGPDSTDTALRRFARAQLEHRQRQSESAILTLNYLLDEFGDHPLADDARYLRAGLLLDTGRLDDAMQAYLELPLLHPTSYMGDRSLFNAARMAADRMADPEQAISLYERILTEYPRSLLVRDARNQIRILRGDRV